MTAATNSFDHAVDILKSSSRLLVFTGAGISTGSGIPDFRGPRGVWTKRKPVYYDEFLASESKRVDYWDFKLGGYQEFRDAKPNGCHLALIELERADKLAGIVTQNIDGLHQRAGSDSDLLVEIHGTNARTQCVRCRQQQDPAPAMDYFREHRQTPRCQCGGFLKMATIAFGQALESEVLAKAVQLAQQADAVMSLGSTLSVHPAASIPLLAADAGAPYIIVNRGPTDQDDLATVRLEGDVVDIVPELVANALATINR